MFFLAARNAYIRFSTTLMPRSVMATRLVSGRFAPFPLSQRDLIHAQCRA